MDKMEISCGGRGVALRNAQIKEGLSGCDDDFVTIKFSEIPSYLRDGEFYQSLNEENEGDSEVEVPRRCFRQNADIHIHNLRDFELMLRVVAYWGLNTIPAGLIRFCADKPTSLWTDIISQIGFEISFAHELYKIFGPAGRADALPIAIKLGKTEVVEFLAKYGNRTERGAVAAAECGRVDYLTLLYDHGHPWDKDACSSAAEFGHLECLMYLHENGCPWDHQVYINAAHCDSMPCIEYAYENGLAWHVDVGIAIATSRRFDMLIYAVQRGCPHHADMTQYAAQAANSECLQYFLEVNCPINDAMQYACQEGRINSLQLLHENGVPWDETITRIAAEYNQLECLQYLHENGCPWDEEVSSIAAKNSNIDILRYCFDNGCPYGDYIVIKAADSRSANGLECVRYLVEDQGIYMNRDGRVFAAAFGNANVELVKYLLDIGCPYQDYSNATPLCLRHYQMMRVKYALKDSKRFELDLLECVTVALERGYDFSKDFLYLLSAQFPLCEGYLELEGHYIPGWYIKCHFSDNKTTLSYSSTFLDYDIDSDDSTFC